MLEMLDSTEIRPLPTEHEFAFNKKRDFASSFQKSTTHHSYKHQFEQTHLIPHICISKTVINKISSLN